MARRHQLIEHDILTTVLLHSDHNGYPTSLPDLASVFHESLPDIKEHELVDALRRLHPKHLTSQKWNDGIRQFLEYPAFAFQAGDFRLLRTPHTDPYAQDLREVFRAQGSSVEDSMNEAKRKARFERWETLGLDRVKSDLMQTGGMRDVGGTPEVRQLAWEWVRMKEGQATAPAVIRVNDQGTKFIADSRLEELRKLSSRDYDFQKLIRLCEELNSSYDSGNFYATAMLTRAILDHVPPLLGHFTFAQVANNYSGGGRSFKETMQHLDGAARKISDGHLHIPIRKSETLPTRQQVNCTSQLDALLAEIIRTLK